jgi:DNA repair protein RadA/Sms
MAKVKHQYRCQQCGYVSAMAMGRCPDCQAWGSLQEEFLDPTGGAGAAAKPGPKRIGATKPQPIRLSTVTLPTQDRYATGIGELDRVLGSGTSSGASATGNDTNGNGLMPGSYILLGGDPGIGKSTLVLQWAARMPQCQILYIAGEESPEQIKHRADRLGLPLDHVWVYAECQVTECLATVQELRPHMLIVDSIQSMYHPDMSNTPGSTAQIRECAGVLMQVAKTLGITTVLIGHVTKDGQLSGPKLLEHLVDVVLTFEGDKYQPLRVLRANKNRFGSTQEVGLFEMTELGLKEVTNPSEHFTSHNRQHPLPGSALTVTLEGRRPLMIELQALVSPSAYASPRRLANGVDTNRLHQVVAVVEKQLGIDFSRMDVYINAVGGFTVEEPAADLAMAMALVTSWRQVSLPPGWVIMGELGLTGELRRITGLPVRLAESQRMGLSHALYPAAAETTKQTKTTKTPASSTLTPHGINTLLQAITTVLG